MCAYFKRLAIWGVPKRENVSIMKDRLSCGTRTIFFLQFRKQRLDQVTAAFFSVVWLLFTSRTGKRRLARNLYAALGSQ